ncbi:GNAT family N-acetyltransferase [Ferrimonas gelatinilytica]|uniref:GNAT family N-acetyltransferase n=1 Tax=Ferrimonas gelatinilytica TaxID=1255257 RepID=A0ABP9RTV0_9GAMM
MIPMTLRDAPLEEIAALTAQIPEFDLPYQLPDYQQRLADTPYRARVMEVAGEAAGFMVGYARDDSEFYCWMAGVLPDFRRLGLSQLLLTDHMEAAAEAGYQRLTVKSRNRYPAMLRLLIQNGFHLVALEKRGDDPQDHRLHLEKTPSTTCEG